ncbi:hypothetical protein OSH39_22560, partial [Mycobacterium ulcerans]
QPPPRPPQSTIPQLTSLLINNAGALPLPAVAAIAGLVAFYNEKLDISVDGVNLSRPRTHFG